MIVIYLQWIFSIASKTLIYPLQHDNLDNKSLEFVFDLHKAANKEAIRLAGELDFVREIRKEISRALKRHPKFSKKIKSYKMDRLRIKKLILTDRG